MREEHDRWQFEHSKKGRLYERNNHVCRSAHCPAHYSAAPQDAQAETTDRPVRNANGLPVLRIDHIAIEAMLHGVWQVPYKSGVFNGREMNRRFLRYLLTFDPFILYPWQLWRKRARVVALRTLLICG